MGKPAFRGDSQTTGSETSQYRQENKSIEISKVVASEMETV